MFEYNLQKQINSNNRCTVRCSQFHNASLRIMRLSYMTCVYDMFLKITVIDDEREVFGLYFQKSAFCQEIC